MTDPGTQTFLKAAAPARRGISICRWISGLLVLMVMFVFGGCERSRVALLAKDPSPRNPTMKEIHVQMTGPIDGVRYKFFADHGECDPQQSNAPITLFRFAEDVDSDRVTVDMWRGETWSGQASVEVHRDRSVVLPMPEIKIEILKVPLARKGGPDTRVELSGKVSGDVSRDFKVLVYARDGGVWYLQPFAYSKHDIAPDNSWATWSHAGYAYAALVVRPDFIPAKTVDVIPPVRGSVLARIVVDGRSE